jgi:hypothetical protein
MARIIARVTASSEKAIPKKEKEQSPVGRRFTAEAAVPALRLNQNA